MKQQFSKELPDLYREFKKIIEKRKIADHPIELLLFIFRDIWDETILTENLKMIMQKIFAAEPPKTTEDSQKIIDVLVNLANSLVSFFTEIDFIQERDDEDELEELVGDLVKKILKLETNIRQLNGSLRKEAEYILTKANRKIGFNFGFDDPPPSDNPVEDFPGDQYYFYFLALSLKESDEPAESPSDYYEFLYNIYTSIWKLDFIRRESWKIKNLNPGRNSLCPCGSGKKYKHCHGG